MFINLTPHLIKVQVEVTVQDPVQNQNLTVIQGRHFAPSPS